MDWLETLFRQSAHKTDSGESWTTPNSTHINFFTICWINWGQRTRPPFWRFTKQGGHQMFPPFGRPLNLPLSAHFLVFKTIMTPKFHSLCMCRTVCPYMWSKMILISSSMLHSQYNKNVIICGKCFLSYLVGYKLKQSKINGNPLVASKFTIVLMFLYTSHRTC